jgi:hypothetical protein
MAKMRVSIMGSICIVFLFGCGGGKKDSLSSDDSSSSSTAPVSQPGTLEGIFKGTTSNGRTAIGLVLDDGTVYSLYSANSNPAVIAGAVIGSGSASNGSFSSTDARDFNLEGLGVLSANISASYTIKQTFNGTVTYPSLSQTITFTGAYDALYETPSSLATIAGNYVGTGGAPFLVEKVSITVSDAGAITGTGTSGCKFNGTVVPRPKGNLYNLSATFGGAPCKLANTAFAGIAYFDTATKRLFAVGQTAARDNGGIYIGLKQ